MGHQITRDWELWVPLTKAEPITSGPHAGAFRVEGIASDESVDLDTEIVKSTGLVDSIAYIEKHGKLNWDHGRDIIGEVDTARFLSKGEARRRYSASITGQGFEVGGIVYPIADPLIAPEDLKRAHHAFNVGARLGLSLQGKVVRQSRQKSLSGEPVTINDQCFVNMVAVTPQPKNSNTTVRLAKSLSAAISEAIDDTPDEDTTTEHAPFLVIAKAMQVGYGTDHDTFTGVRAVTPESLEGAPKRLAPDVGGATGKRRKRKKRRSRATPDEELVVKAIWIAALAETPPDRRGAKWNATLELLKAGRTPRLGTGSRFRRLVSKLKRRGAKNPRALASWIGRRKYGTKRFARLSRHR